MSATVAVPLLLATAGSLWLGAAARGQCQPRLDFPFSVVQLDGAGRACWGQLSIVTCWGHCSSHQVPDWRFPYRRSHHPVCLHEVVRLAAATLANCEPDATPGTEVYRYLEPISCSCAVCNSALASCQSSPYHATRGRPPATDTRGDLADDDGRPAVGAQ